MWNNMSLSTFLGRVSLMEHPLNRAREFFQRSVSSDDENHVKGESSDENDVITCGASSVDMETEEEAEREWCNPGDTTVDMVTNLFSKLWQEDVGAVDLDVLEDSLASCPPKENVLLIEDEDHYNLLMKAVIYDSVPMMQILLSHGCDVGWIGRKSCMHTTTCPNYNVGVLHMACYLGRKEMVDMLLRWGAEKRSKQKISTTVPINCSDKFKLDNNVFCKTSEKEEITRSCGAREPIFFAVLGDQVEIIKLFMEGDTSHRYVEELHLLHLACRIGAGNCLKYLLSSCPGVVNTFDTDGMPPLLLVMKHGLKYVSLILDSGCDVTMFNDLWERGANIYHFLFSALPIGDEDHVTLCDILRYITKSKMVDINSKRESSGSTPLHELIHAINRVPRGNGQICDIRSTYLMSYDKSILDSIQFLIENGADVQALDISGNSTLCNILANKNQLARCALFLNEEVPQHSRNNLKYANFGLDNVITVVEKLMNNNVLEGNGDAIRSPISVLLKTICTFDNDIEEIMWTSPFEILKQGSIMAKYCELLRMLLKICDPNTNGGELTPLFYLLSQATLSPDPDNYMYIISVEHAQYLAALADILLENGARTECEHSDDGLEIIQYSCMDVLIYFLRKMQAYPHSRTNDDLIALKTLLLVILKYGGQTFLHNTKFYHGPDLLNSETSSGLSERNHPTFTFLYQYLCFGAMNLQYVNDGDVYYDLLAVIATATPQSVVYLAFRSARLVFTCMHWPYTCDCGLCYGFHSMLDSYLAAPRTLKQICRLTVRDSIQNISPTTVKRLHLPKSTEKYILLQDA